MINLKGFGFENFRQFCGFSFINFSKLNIFTGPNNSGKSTFIKALILLSESQKTWSEISLWGERLNFNNIKYNLGGLSPNYSQDSKNLSFYIGFGKYNFSYEFDNKGELLYNYKITKGNNLVIQQAGGDLQINFKNFIDYLKYKKGISNGNIEKTSDDFIISINNYLRTNPPYLSLILEELDDADNLTAFIYNKGSNYITNKDLDDYTELTNLNTEIGIDDADLVQESTLRFLFQKLIGITIIDDKFFKFLFPNINPKFQFLPEIFYLPSLKIGGIKRSYSFEESSTFKDLMHEYIERNKNSFLLQNGVFNDFLVIWLEKFNIPKDIKIEYDETKGVYFMTIENKSIVDFGLGTAQLISIMLWIDNVSSRSYKYINYRPILILEEPETNLHPDLQSKFIEFIVEMMDRDDFQVLIETHSEYFIRKIQYLTATKKIEKDKTKIFYFNKPKSDVKISEITINEDGSLTDDLGSGFLDEADNIALALYKIQKKNLN